MGAIASLESTLISVAPGEEASVELTIRNNGSVVDQMTITVLGDSADWAMPDPPTLSLFPGAEGTASITFSPPRSSAVPAGEMAFGVRVASQEDPEGSVVEEGRLDIGPFSDIGAELQPRTSRGARGARHDLAVDNRGNVPINATVTGADPEEALAFDIDPPGIVAEPGQASFARVDVKTRKRFWRGQPKSRPFLLQVETPDQPPVPVEGTLLQEPMIPGWLIKALIALALLAIGLLLLWFLFLRPTVLTAAEERAGEIAADVAKQTTDDALADAGIDPDGGGSGGGGAPSPSPSPSPSVSPVPSPTPSPTPTPTPAPTPTPEPTGRPQHARLAVGNQIVFPPDGKALHLTDLVFSNPLPQEGELVLRLNEDDDLFVLRLENFRDLDFHFVTPLVVEPGDALSLRCTLGSCEGAAVLYSGLEREP